jgi:hypothetical protein
MTIARAGSDVTSRSVDTRADRCATPILIRAYSSILRE